MWASPTAGMDATISHSGRPEQQYDVSGSWRVDRFRTTPCLPTPLGLDLAHERRQVDAEGTREEVDVDEPNVPTPTLDVADVGGMEARPLGETLLREAACDPERPHRGSESAQRFV